jgi:hypothetical protein
MLFAQEGGPAFMVGAFQAATGAGFHKSADYLIRMVLKESADSFFDIWELGTKFQNLRRLAGRSPGASVWLSRWLDSVSARILELSRFDFQHLRRSFDFFSAQNRDDLAELVLTGAAGLAETC